MSNNIHTSSKTSMSSNSGFGSQFKSAIRTAKVEHLVAGFSGGVVSTLVLHPLDLLKIRFAVDDGKEIHRPKYSGLRNAVTSIFKQEGFKGFYKGVTPNVAGAGTAWGFYFLFYNKIKTGKQKGDTKTQLSPGSHMTCAAQAGVLTLILTNPIWVVKTRLCLQFENKGNYKGMLDAFYKIALTEGIRGLYKGFVPGLWGVSHGAIQFMVYEELKSSYSNFYNQPIDTKLGTLEYLSFSALSKFIAALTTYPYQVVRARLQDQNSRYKGALDCIRKTIRYEGIAGLYKGMVPCLIHSLPNICVVFLIHEKLTN